MTHYRRVQADTRQLNPQRRVVVLILFAFLLSSLSCEPTLVHCASAEKTRGSDTSGSWTEFRGNLNNTGYSISGVPSSNRIFLDFNAHFQIRSSGVISDEILYFGSDYARIYAVNISTGRELWNFSTGSEVWATPLIVGDRVFIGSSDNNFYALNRQTGDPDWTFPTGDDIHSSAKHVNGMIVIGSLDGNLYFLDAETGNETISSFQTGGPIYDTPAIVQNTAIVGSNDGKVYRISLEDGSELWNFTLSSTPGENVKYSSPAVFSDKVYIGSNDHNFYCLDLETGNLVWVFETEDYVYASPAIHDGIVFVHSTDGWLHALPLEDPDGNGNITNNEILWSFETQDGGGRGEGGSSPAVAGGKVIVGSHLGFMLGYVYVLDEKTGNETWRLKLWGTYSSPTIADGRIFIGTSEGHMYGISELAPGMSLEIVPESHEIKSERLMVIEFILAIGDDPVEGAFINFYVSEGVLSQSGASTLADGIQRVKYLSPDVAENITVTVSGRATKYGMEEARASINITIVPAKDYEETASGSTFSWEKYLPFLVAIITLILLNVIVYATLRRKRRLSE